MKIFTYLRTVWHEFWMYMLVGAPSKEEGLSPRVDPYWTLLVANNINLIHDDLGTEVVPETEEEARTLYMRWCEVTDVPAPAPALPKVTAQVNTGTETARLMTEGLNLSANLVPKMDFGGMLVKFDEKKLWVYNVSRVDHKFDHPMLGNVTIPANKTRKRYSLWTSFSEIVTGTNYNIEENLLYPHAIKGEYFVNDLINPDCHGSNGSKSIGRDFSVRGVFWSYNNPPKVSEVNAAVKKLKAHYADLLEKIATLYAGSLPNMDRAKKLTEEVQIDEDGEELPKLTLEEAYEKSRMWRFEGLVTPECHAACEYFKVTTPWHPVLRGQETQNV